MHCISSTSFSLSLVKALTSDSENVVLEMAHGIKIYGARMVTFEGIPFLGSHKAQNKTNLQAATLV